MVVTKKKNYYMMMLGAAAVQPNSTSRVFRWCSGKKESVLVSKILSSSVFIVYIIAAGKVVVVFLATREELFHIRFERGN